MTFDELMQRDVNQLTQAFLMIRNHTAAEQKALDDRLKPYKDQMEQIRNALSAKLTAANVNSMKCESGTPYKSTTATVKMEDWDAFHAFVEETQEPDFLIKGANKTKCQEWLDTHGTPPPGIKLDFVTTLNVRT